MFLKHIFGVVFLIILTNAIKSYENYKVYNIIPKSDVEVQMINDLRKEGFDLWTDVITVGNDARVMVSPTQDEEFIKYGATVGLGLKLTVPNVQELIQAQLKPAQSSDRSRNLGSFSWDEYHTLEEIHAWLDELQVLYPNTVTTMSIGTTYEGRELKGVIIDFKSDRQGTPLIGMIEGGIHSREWISPATVTWIIKEFLTSNDPDVRFMAEAFVWHIIPVTNPDGYAYTFSGDRMWRKNRNPVNHVNCTSGDDDLGNGIDLNRNFDFLWMTVGATANPCTQTYAGPNSASEREAQAISSYVLSLKQSGNMIYYFAFHSYSQMILVPYSHVSGYEVLTVPNYADLYEIGIRGAEKLTATHGTPYQVGTSADILYEVSGSSFDWVKGVAEIPVVYLFELRDLGAYGFLLPKEQIIPNNEEIMACLVEMDKVTRQLGYYSGTNSVFASLTLLIISIWFSIIVQ